MQVSEIIQPIPEAIDPASLTLSIERTLGAYADGDPWGDYLVSVSYQGRQLLYISAGVNDVVHDVRVGLDTLNIIDIVINEPGVPLDLRFDTTNKTKAYGLGARLGPGVVRSVMRKILVVVRQDFPDVARIIGFRMTGAKYRHRKGDERGTALRVPIR